MCGVWLQEKGQHFHLSILTWKFPEHQKEKTPPSTPPCPCISPFMTEMSLSSPNTPCTIFQVTTFQPAAYGQIHLHNSKDKYYYYKNCTKVSLLHSIYFEKVSPKMESFPLIECLTDVMVEPQARFGVPVPHNLLLEIRKDGKSLTTKHLNTS